MSKKYEQKNIRLYDYVGSKEIKNAVKNYPMGVKITAKEDIKNWIHSTNQEIDQSGLLICTFVIDSEGYLRIADRHSEHVACSGGNSVLSAGEIFFISDKDNYEIAEISNQSTGFCPEPESWFFVAKALDKISLDNPNEFTISFIFRRCVKCDLLNVVKENLFICADCKTELPKDWNCNLV